MLAKRGSSLRRGLSVLAGVGLVGLAAACSTADTRSYKGLRVSDDAVPRVGEVLLSMAQCPVSKKPKDISSTQSMAAASGATALVGLAVDVAANAVEEALKAAAERLSGSFLALGSLTANQDEPQTYCVIVARGLFGSANGISDRNGKMTPEHLKALSLADYPAFYLELEANIQKVARRVRNESGDEVAGEESVMTLTPVYLRYAQSVAVDGGSKKKNVTLALALARKQPSGKDTLEEGAAAVFRINFGRLEVGREYDEAHLKHLAAAQTVDENAGPSVAALVTDSEEPSIALKALTSAFSSNKVDLAKAFKDAFAGAAGAGN